MRKFIDKLIDRRVEKALKRYSTSSLQYRYERDIKLSRAINNVEQLYLGSGGDIYILLEGEIKPRKVKKIRAVNQGTDRKRGK